MKRLASLVVLVVVLIGVTVATPQVRQLWKRVREALRDAALVKPPSYPAMTRTLWLEQNWTPQQRDWFHHVDQGTQTFRIPYEWFIALEKPEFSLFDAGFLSDSTYLDRFGFIPDDSRASTPGLPVGFARGGEMRRDDGAVWVNPRTNKPMARIGLTCAACHTGRFTYNGTAVYVDGGSALADVFRFQGATGLALGFAQQVPGRFGRFADRVLGADADAATRALLKAQLDEVVAKYADVRDLEEKMNPQGFEEGFARLDALNRIGNAVFSTDLGRPENYAGPLAPVHFPRIWNASWFTWVQYNGAIEQPMVRNAGEALGVLAWINMKGGQTPLFTSSAQLNALFELEKLLAGRPPDMEYGFSGLNSPKWPQDLLRAPDTALAARGATLYDNMCRPCHLPPVTTPEFWKSERWLSPNTARERYLDVKLIDIESVGTDAAQAEDMKARHVSLPETLGIGDREFGPALGKLVALAMNRWYDDQHPPVPADRRDEMNGHRPNGIQAVLKYKARPLNGVWATPPYLHNGSVPTLYALLSPANERPTVFYLGDREYDPKNVGYRGHEIASGFRFDTKLPGNHNTGHEFNDGPIGHGVIGRKLSPDERYAIIEFLKTQ